jgi:hypothetical protein
MSLTEYAYMARILTDSKLSNTEVVSGVIKLKANKKMTVCPEIDRMVKERQVQFVKDFAKIKEVFCEVAAKHQIDSAVLYWTYIQWLKDN